MEYSGAHALSCQPRVEDRTRSSLESRFGGADDDDKATTGITGFDSITRGGLPRGRISLVSGAHGTGKTSFGLEFLINGALDSGETGLFVSTRESVEDLVDKARSLGCPTHETIGTGRIVLVSLQQRQGRHSRCHDADPAQCLTRLLCLAARSQARRLCIDGFEVPFGSLSNRAPLRSCLKRLTHRTHQTRLTTLLTCEPRSSGTFSRSGYVEYRSDLVVQLACERNALDSYRYLRIIKCRSSVFETGNHFFTIGADGVNVLTTLAFKESNYPIASQMGERNSSASPSTIGLYL